jgi:glycosyltransferase involved in cell wall biosynthesis
MRIALVGDRPPPHGGISVHVENLASQLQQAGTQVEVLDTAHTRSLPAFSRKLASLVARGFLLHVHTAGHNEKSWLLAMTGGLARGPLHRNLITLHSGLLPDYLEGVPSRRWAARLALAPYGRVVAVSGAIGQALVEAGVPAQNLVLLPAFSAGAVRPTQPPAAFSTLRSRHAPLLACALAPSPIYGSRVLLAALALLGRKLPRVGCAVYGPDLDELRPLAKELGVVDRVHVLGELEHGAALALVRDSDAFVRPTLGDGDALSVREALALGVPVVASDAVPRPDGVHPFQSGDPFSLAEVLERVGSEAMQRGNHARQDARSPRSPAKDVRLGRSHDSVPRLLELYRELRTNFELPRLFQGLRRGGG